MTNKWVINVWRRQQGCNWVCVHRRQSWAWLLTAEWPLGVSLQREALPEHFHAACVMLHYSARVFYGTYTGLTMLRSLATLHLQSQPWLRALGRVVTRSVAGKTRVQRARRLLFTFDAWEFELCSSSSSRGGGIRAGSFALWLRIRKRTGSVWDSL